MRKILLCGISLLLLLLTSTFLNAQQVNQVSATTDWMVFPQASNAGSPTAFIQQQKAVLGLGLNDDIQLKRTDVDKLGYQHHRLDQYYKGIFVEDGEYILHERNGKVERGNGHLIKGINASIIPQIKGEEAVKIALDYIDAEVYMWENEALSKSLLEIHNSDCHGHYPEPELVLVNPKFNRQAALYRLAYKMDVYSFEPFGRKWVYVDAIDGKVLTTEEQMHSHNVEGTANTAYYGEKKIITDSIAPGQYRLRETARGRGTDITTLNLMNISRDSLFSIPNRDFPIVDFTDEDNYWDNFNLKKDEYATDTHWGMEETYDFFLEHFDRNSIDDEGHELRSYIHVGLGYNNAFWSRDAMFYGDGSGNNGPFMPIEIVGHEAAHGLTQKTANLRYRYESGALNESFSDIFGIAVRFYSSAEFKWEIGDKLALSDQRGFRNMSSPNMEGHPDTYLGDFWSRADSTVDNGGVHTNSGVQNFWFYLLVNGGNDVNDNGDEYNVNALGWEKALQISYRNLVYYLSRLSTYRDARNGAIQAAIDLYGECSIEVEAVENAWAAVGVGNVAKQFDITPTQVDLETIVCGRTNETLVFNLDHLSCLSVLPTDDTIQFSYKINDEAVVTEDFILGADLQPKTSLSYTFQQQADFSEVGYYDVAIWANYSKDNFNANDTIRMRIENRAVQNEDWGITAVLSPDIYRCDYGTEETLSIIATYSGCEPLPAGTQLPIIFDINGGQSVSEVFTIPAINPDESIELTFTDKVDLTLEGFNNFTIASNNPNDMWVANNAYQWPVLNGITRPRSNYLTYETELALSDSTRVFPAPHSRIYRDSLSDVNGTQGLVITGGEPIGPGGTLQFRVPTEDNTIWELNPDFISNIEFCVDARSWSDVQLTFDAEISYAIIWGSAYLRGIAVQEFASAFRILVDGVQIGEDYHANRIENLLKEMEHYEVDLSQYAGQKFTLTFQTHVLRDNVYDERSSFSDGDNVVLDNIWLGTSALVPTHDPGLAVSDMKVYPNPASQQLQIDLDLPEASRLSIDLINVLGQKVQSQAATAFGQGTTTTTFNVNQLPTGIYWLVVSDGTNQRSERVVITK